MAEVKRYWVCDLYFQSKPSGPVIGTGKDVEVVLASDYDREHQRRVEAEEALDAMYLTVVSGHVSDDVYDQCIRIRDAWLKEGSDGTA